MKLKLIPLVLTGSVALSACVANLQNPFSSKLPEQKQAEPVQPAQPAVVKQASPELVKRFEKLILSCNNGKAPPNIIGEDGAILPIEKSKWANVFQLAKELGFTHVEVSKERSEYKHIQLEGFISYRRNQPLMILGQPTDEIRLARGFGEGSGHTFFEVVFPSESFKTLEKKYPAKEFYKDEFEEGGGNYYGRYVSQQEDGRASLMCSEDSFTP